MGYIICEIKCGQNPRVIELKSPIRIGPVKKLPANDERERSTSHRVRQDTIDFRRTTGAIKGFIADGLFIGQQRSAEFINLILDMAAQADAAQRE